MRKGRKNGISWGLGAIVGGCLLFLVSCGGSGAQGGGKGIGGDLTISIESQPSNAAVTAGQPAQFSVTASSSDGSPLSYDWAMKAPGAQTATDVGTNSSILQIPGSSITTAVSGSVFSVTISATDGTVSQTTTSTDAILTVAPLTTPPAGNPNPAFYSATPLPMGAYTETNNGDTFASTIPTVPANAVISACFVWNSYPQAQQALLDATDVVTDNENDSFALTQFSNMAQSANDPDNVNDLGGYCYSALSVGGSNVSVTVNVQSLIGNNTGAGSLFGGVLLVYTGIQGKIDSTSENNGVLNEEGYTAGTVTTNLPNELILAIGVTGSTINGAGAGFVSRYVGPACYCASQTAFVVEDAIGPSTAHGSVTPSFYTAQVLDVPFDANAVSLY